MDMMMSKFVNKDAKSKEIDPNVINGKWRRMGFKEEIITIY